MAIADVLNGEAGSSVRDKINSLISSNNFGLLATRPFASRSAALAADLSGLADGDVVTWLDARTGRLVSLVKTTGATSVPGFTGFAPLGRRMPQHYGAVGDWVTSDSVAVLAWLSDGGGFAPAGRYRMGSNGTITTDYTCVEGEGDQTIFDYSTKSTKANCFEATGSIGSAHVLTANVSEFDTTITVPDGSLWSEGDMFKMYSDDKYRGVAGEAGFAGEINWVETVSGNTIKLKIPSRHDYTTANAASIAKITPVKGLTFKNFKLVGTGQTYIPGGSGTADSGIRLTYTDEVTIQGVTTQDVERQGFHFENSANGTVLDFDINFAEELTSSQIIYGVTFYDACQTMKVERGNVYRGRHAVVQSEGASTRGVTYDVTVEAVNAYKTYEAAFSTHIRAGNFEWIGCCAFGANKGYDLRTPDHRISGGQLVDLTNDALILRNLADNISFTGVQMKNVARLGRWGSTSDNRAASNIRIQGNTIDGYSTGFKFEVWNTTTTSGGYHTEEAKDWHFVNNTFQGGVSQAIALDGFFKGGTISGNSYRLDSGTPNYCVYLNGAQDFEINNEIMNGSRGVLISQTADTSNGAGGTSIRVGSGNRVSGLSGRNIFSSDKIVQSTGGANNYPIIGPGVNNWDRKTKTISSGALGIAEAELVTVAAESGTADDLVNITPMGKEQHLLIKADTGDTITVKRTGNISLQSGTDFTLSGTKVLHLFSADGVNWTDVA